MAMVVIGFAVGMAPTGVEAATVGIDGRGNGE
jgi:hypothetical protein